MNLFSLRHHGRAGLLLGLVGASFSAPITAAEPPVIPVGMDAYRQWERWPHLRIGARTYMRSTYDRRGGNEGADASHFLYQTADDFNVSLDVEGAGVLYFARFNHWHGSPWHYVVDGADHVVRESSTADPNNPVRDSVFEPGGLFPMPLAWTWSVTKGADLNWVPMPFEKSLRLAYSRTRYGTGYYIYQQFVPGVPLSQPIKAWDGQKVPDQDVLDLINRAGTSLAPAGLERVGGKALTLAKNATVLLHKITPAEPAMLRALEFSAPRSQAIALGRAELRVTWDDAPHPSIEAPLALFFGAGTLYNRDDREYLVKAFPMNIRFDAERVHLACFFPMPFFRSAKIELIGRGTDDVSDIEWSTGTQPFHDPPEHVGYFHASYRDHPDPKRGHDLVLLDTRETEGGGDWMGHFVGTSFIFSDRANLNTLEGDPRFFFDDSQTPQAQGTGTEEWGGGGDYWGGVNMTLPFAGHPTGAKPGQALNDEDKIESAYRFLLADLIPFGRNAVIRLEHGATNDSTEHYRTVTYWYGRRGAALVKTDELKIGDAVSRAAHHYVSPQASEPYVITSRYEWGPDVGSNGGDKPVADPKDCAEFEFEAAAGTTYMIWVRGRNLNGKNSTDASWFQFDDDIGTAHLGSGSNHVKGLGNWLDRFPAGTSAWSSALPQDPPQTVQFTRGGRHKLRIQPRQPGHVIEQIWLSSTQKLLPTASQSSPTPSTAEIILTPQDTTVLKGKIKLNGDHTALVIDGRDTTQKEDLMFYPAHTDRGRKTTGSSEFTLKLDPKNLGVMLRRKLDYQYPNQRAEVFIADPSGNGWQRAGIWYLAGSNTCVYSNPKEELGATQHNAQTSNRRFRDDEFLVPRALTTGRTEIRVRVTFTPTNIPLFPGRPLDEQAWSEIRYDAFCFQLPPVSP